MIIPASAVLGRNAAACGGRDQAIGRYRRGIIVAGQEHGQIGHIVVDQVRADPQVGKLRSHRAELEADPGLIYGMVQEIVLPRFDFELISR